VFRVIYILAQNTEQKTVHALLNKAKNLHHRKSRLEVNTR